MRLALTSDLHGNLPEIPEADLLVIAGDITPLSLTKMSSLQLNWLDTKFRPWLESVPVKVVVGVAGNHDHVFQERRRDVRNLNLPWAYLEDSKATLLDLKIWGSPWSPTFGKGWAFNAGLEKQMGVFSMIPENLDLLIVHGPPYGYGDRTEEGLNVGSYILKDVIEERKPKLVVTGHIHEGRGCYKTPWGTHIINASQCDRNYRVIPEVAVFDTEETVEK